MECIGNVSCIPGGSALKPDRIIHSLLCPLWLHRRQLAHAAPSVAARIHEAATPQFQSQSPSTAPDKAFTFSGVDQASSEFAKSRDESSFKSEVLKDATADRYGSVGISVAEDSKGGSQNGKVWHNPDGMVEQSIGEGDMQLPLKQISKK